MMIYADVRCFLPSILFKIESENAPPLNPILRTTARTLRPRNTTRIQHDFTVHIVFHI